MKVIVIVIGVLAMLVVGPYLESKGILTTAGDGALFASIIYASLFFTFLYSK